MLGLPFGHSHPHFANRFYFSLFLYFHFLKNLYLSLSLSLSWAWIPRDLQKIKAPGCRALEWEAEKSFKKTQKRLRIKS